MTFSLLLDIDAIAWKKMEWGTFFIGLWVILGVWAGMAGVLSPLIPILALILTFLFFNGHEKIKKENTVPTNGLLFFSALLIIGFSFVLFGVQGGFDLSADTAPVVAAQLISSKIPLTYAPYSSLPFVYPPGLPVVAAQVGIVGIPIHQIVWALGLVGFLLLMWSVTRWVWAVGQKDIRLAWVVPALFLTLRLPMQNILTGEYAFVLGMGLGVSAWNSGNDSPKSTLHTIVLLAASFLVHPYAGIVSFVGLFFSEMVFRPSIDWKKWVKLGVGVGVFFIPYLVQLAALRNFPPAEIPLGSLNLGSLVPMVSLVGLIPFLVCFILLVLGFFRRQMGKGTLSPQEKVLGRFVLLGIIGFLLGNVKPEWVMGPKFLLLTCIGLVGWGSLRLSPLLTGRVVQAGALGLVLLGVLVVGTSPTMQGYVTGSKLTLGEAHAAEWIREYVPLHSRVWFLSDGEGKMGEYSKTIPSDMVQSHYFNYTLLHGILTPEVDRIISTASTSNRIRKSQQYVPLSLFEPEYVLVDTRIFPPLTKTPLGEKDGFVIYALQK
jgi:hypothetical protein